MPLLAMIDGVRTVSSLMTVEEWGALKTDVRSKRRRVELPCGSAGHAKTSRLGTQYFAHNAGGDSCSAGEGAEHLLAKSIIIQAARAAGWDAEPEYRGDGWVADVMATKGGSRVAFEVQWSPQTPEDFTLRQERYAEHGVRGAWFARKTTGLSLRDRNLPAFRFEVNGDQVDVTIEGVVMALSEVITRLLSSRIQFRDYLANGGPAETDLAFHLTRCYRCHKGYVVWNVLHTVVTGLCGASLPTATAPRSMWSQTRPEADPAVVETARSIAVERGWTPARLGLRHTQTSSTKYMAFICPHCNATSGDFFIRKQFTQEEPEAIVSGTGPRTAVVHPHWCVASKDQCCLVPPKEVLDMVTRDASRDTELGPSVNLTPVTRLNHRSVIAAMLGGDRFH